jgi:hypothetical protein
VEKLVTKGEEESWKEMAIMVDSSATFETEAMKCQAVRKYAAYYKMPVEEVKTEAVVNDSWGVRGWCEMNITVPGINDKDGKENQKVEVQPAAKKASAKKKKQAPAPEQGESVGDANGPQPAQPKPKDPKPKKAKKELTELQKNETTSKAMLAQLQRSQQIMSKVSGHGDQIPSEWKWALPFLQEYEALLTAFTESLAPKDGDDIKDFVDEMKLSTLDKTKTKQFKNTYKDRYGTLLALFVDRSSSLAAQKLPSMKLDIFFPMCKLL